MKNWVQFIIMWTTLILVFNAHCHINNYYPCHFIAPLIKIVCISNTCQVPFGIIRNFYMHILTLKRMVFNTTSGFFDWLNIYTTHQLPPSVIYNVRVLCLRRYMHNFGHAYGIIIFNNRHHIIKVKITSKSMGSCLHNIKRSVGGLGLLHDDYNGHWTWTDWLRLMCWYDLMGWWMNGVDEN